MARIKIAKTLTVQATCPSCGFGLNPVPLPTQPGDKYDNGHDGGKGGFLTACESCAKPFVIEAEAVHEVQHAALVLLGEA